MDTTLHEIDKFVKEDNEWEVSHLPIKVHDYILQKSKEVNLADCIGHPSAKFNLNNNFNFHDVSIYE